jgi:hypothetical protein
MNADEYQLAAERLRPDRGASLRGARPPRRPVATPIEWEELGRVESRSYTIGNIGRRLASKGDSLARPVGPGALHRPTAGEARPPHQRGELRVPGSTRPIASPR